MKKKEFLVLSPHELAGTIKKVDKQLQESLRSNGQAFPLVIYGDKAPFTIIDGHKRFTVLRDFSSKIECLRLLECSFGDAANEEIRMNAQRGLTMQEKSVLVGKLQKNGIGEEKIIHEYLKKLKIPQEKRMLTHLASITELPAEEQTFFSGKNFGEYLLRLVFNLPTEDRSTFLRFAVKFGLNHNQGRDLLEKLQQIRSIKPLKDVLKPWFERLENEPEKSGILLKRFILELDSFCNKGSETWQKLQEIKETLPRNIAFDEKEYLKNGVLTVTVRMKSLKDTINLAIAQDLLKKIL